MNDTALQLIVAADGYLKKRPKCPQNYMGVYKITCTVTGDIYIGSSVNVGKRWTQHRKDLTARKHHSAKLQQLWDRLGAAAFSLKLIESVTDKEILRKREKHYILQYDSVKNGCNGTYETEKSSIIVQHNKINRVIEFNGRGKIREKSLSRIERSVLKQYGQKHLLDMLKADGVVYKSKFTAYRAY